MWTGKCFAIASLLALLALGGCATTSGVRYSQGYPSQNFSQTQVAPRGYYQAAGYQSSVDATSIESKKVQDALEYLPDGASPVSWQSAFGPVSIAVGNDRKLNGTMCRDYRISSGGRTQNGFACKTGNGTWQEAERQVTQNNTQAPTQTPPVRVQEQHVAERPMVRAPQRVKYPRRSGPPQFTNWDGRGH